MSKGGPHTFRVGAFSFSWLKWKEEKHKSQSCLLLSDTAVPLRDLPGGFPGPSNRHPGGRACAALCAGAGNSVPLRCCGGDGRLLIPAWWSCCWGWAGRASLPHGEAAWRRPSPRKRGRPWCCRRFKLRCGTREPSGRGWSPGRVLRGGAWGTFWKGVELLRGRAAGRTFWKGWSYGGALRGRAWQGSPVGLGAGRAVNAERSWLTP